MTSSKSTYMVSLEFQIQSSCIFYRSWLRPSGTFLRSITPNATLAYNVRYGTSADSEGGVLGFCGAFTDGIDQPGSRHGRGCPPVKGFGLIMMSSWVLPMYFTPVSPTMEEIHQGWVD